MVVTFAIYYEQLKNGDANLMNNASNYQDADVNNFDDIYADEDPEIKTGDIVE